MPLEIFSGRGLKLSSARLALVYVALVVVLVSLLLGTVYLLTRNALEREIAAVVRAEAEDLADDLRKGGVDAVAAALRLRKDSWGRQGAVFLLADARLRPVSGNLSDWPRGVSVAQNGAIEFNIIAYENDVAVEHPVVGQVRRLDNGYWLLVGTDTSERLRVLRSFGYATLWGVALTALAVWLLGAAYARRSAQRVRELAATCESIMRGDLARRLKIENARDEYDALATAVNAMLDRIEQQTMTLRTAFNSIAHDLRTPLYRLRVRLEEAQLRSDTPLAMQELIAPTLEDIERLQRTLATLLQIAQAQSSGALAEPERIDLAALVLELADLYAPAMRDAGIELTAQAEEPTFIAGNRQLVAQLITNLLENGSKYVPAGGAVVVAVRGSAYSVLLSVSDNGPGIPEADRAAALQPFVRLASRGDRPGTGLGLSLVAAVARLHGAALSLGDNAPGLVVRCEFPAWRARAAA
jgi:signal transduction histidine kinase